MQSSRRIFFSPTSRPGLRPRRAIKRDFYNAGYSPRLCLRKDVGAWQGIRRESTETGEDQTGHITARSNEGILWFDNLFPLKLNWMLRVPWHTEKDLPELLARFNNSNLGAFEPVALVKRAIPNSVPMTVTEILPRLKDGGAFVKFSHPNGITAKEVEGLLRQYLRENPIKPWFNPFRRIRTNLVVGKPWLEDLYRFPSSRIKVEFAPTSPGKESAELSQETLYSLFRKYGKIAEISPQPSDSKILPKYAHLDFARLSHAIMARNCMHGLKVSEAEGGGTAGTLLRLSFQQKEKAHWIWDWLTSHPRVVIPALAALIATATVAVFDPIRTFFIKAHIEHSFHLKDNKIYQWFKSQATDIFTFRRKRSEEASLIWEDRKQIIDSIQTALMETSSTFIVVQGPRGSGKKDLLTEALKGRRNTLLIDCKPIQDARGDSATICAAAAAVGYRPVFSWANSLSSLVDLAAQGTIGVKSGFSETLDAQLGKVWGNTASALKSAALANRPRNKEDKDAALSDDDWLEAHPEHRPVVLLDNFLHKNEESSIVYDKLSEWAAGLTTANIAHVVFLTNDISYSKSLSKALPDRVFRQISLGDIKPEVAKKFVISHLDVEKGDPVETDTLTPSQKQNDLEELDDAIVAVGGRLTDLEFLARRLKTGQTPRRAIAEMIEQSANEIMKMYLLTVDKGERKWSPEQAWYLIKSLSENGSLRYNEILLTNTFASSLTASASSGESALEALTAAELITITSYKGRPQTVKAGKPIYEAAFKVLAEDKVLKSRLDLAILTELTKIETKSIDKYETELTMLGTLPKQPSELAPRVQFLLMKLAASQQKVEAWEKEMATMKKLLLDEY
ncbi:mitochondrial escape protein 2 [Cadophora gregata]|uniref:mitochondrial escape protein 2 n=1 Tax=Cadophora gregata TaxID=51156 RepID=UPI0026DADF0A|nr:mitochondrial escape protein 2 [Cadophora gregata]KAK0125310.1 mitochondrial escape protein 2 [Cadophora gregata f. sp. sojae]KAK0128707.1 mitochondrial escape protein 2 [Cadophora gregata]